MATNMDAVCAWRQLGLTVMFTSSVGCNGLLDIERHELAPLDDGDASVSPSSGETEQDGGESTELAATGQTRDTGASDSHAVITSNADSTTEHSASSTLDSNDPTEGTPQESDSTASGPADSAASNSSPASEPPDPREAPPSAPNLDAPFECASKLDAWGHTSYCRFTPNGFDELGNPLTKVGDAHVWLYWSDTTLDGWICLIDNVSNGRGLKYRVLVHGEGDPLPSLPIDDVAPEDVWQLVYTDRDEGSKCVWKAFSVTLAKRVDHAMIEWLDLWSDNEHFDGRLIVQAP